MKEQFEKITRITEKRKCNYYPDIGWAFSLDKNDNELDGGFAMYHDCCHLEDLEGNTVLISQNLNQKSLYRK